MAHPVTRPDPNAAAQHQQNAVIAGMTANMRDLNRAMIAALSAQSPLWAMAQRSIPLPPGIHWRKITNRKHEVRIIREP